MSSHSDEVEFVSSRIRTSDQRNCSLPFKGRAGVGMGLRKLTGANGPTDHAL